MNYDNKYIAVYQSWEKRVFKVHCLYEIIKIMRFKTHTAEINDFGYHNYAWFVVDCEGGVRSLNSSFVVVV